MTTYQRLKKENEKLRLQLFAIANDPESIEAKNIIASYRLQLKAEETFWCGDSELVKNIFTGILNKIT